MITKQYIDQIASQLIGRKFVEVPHSDPHRFYRRLYAAAHARELDWRFATTDRSVVIYR